jgi:serine/threonine protein kinase
VADFGLAKSIRANGKARASGYTPQFASPEQLSGLSVTPTTDVWSWAVSVLHMFMGGVIWERGLAAPAVLADYCSRHRRMPGLPQMPQQVAELLEQCLVFDPSKRLSNCHSVAQSLSEIHSDLFGEPIVFAEHGTPELAADSLNNRAVSLLEIGRESEAETMLDRLVKARPAHVEGNFNQLLLMVGRGQIAWPQMEARLGCMNE